VKFHKTPIADVLLIEPQVFGDNRGFFMETWHAPKFEAAGVNMDFVQDNQSRSTQWTLRGMHMQVEHTQGKLVRVTSGSVFDAVVDLRRSSPTFGKWWGTELTERQSSDVVGAAGAGARHTDYLGVGGFSVQMHGYLQPESRANLAWDDPTVGIEWPLPAGADPKLSAKDLVGKSFAEIEKFA
jgi:dTDP-4-dehydrorhamnose 3,5-epimerase